MAQDGASTTEDFIIWMRRQDQRWPGSERLHGVIWYPLALVLHPRPVSTHGKIRGLARPSLF
jgi:hypothetical protein